MLGEVGSTWPGAPLNLTRFLGREAEIAEALQRLDSARLLTMVGPPGTGKTRLALAVAEQLSASYLDGLRSVGLARVLDPDDLPGELAAALGVADAPETRLAESVVDALGPAELVLVLDNCEHLVGRVAEMVREILTKCRGVCVLATSRVPLAVPGEQLFRVPPLRLESAVELFVDRAGLVTDLVLDDSGQEYVDQICRCLDGLPLAIELAASQTRAFSLAEIQSRLDTDLGELMAPGSVVTDRRTMSGTIAWSCRLLAGPQMRFFEQLSVFTGRFDLAAVAAVVDPDDQVGNHLAALVDHSLVLAEPMPSGAMRYRLLEPIRQYAAACLEERGTADDVRARHAWHYREVVREADRNLMTAAGLRWYEVLRRDEGNVLAAIAWARQQCSDLALQLATGMGGYWDHHGLSNEARERVERLMHHGPASPRSRAEALLVLSQFGYRQGRYGEALRDAGEALTTMEALDDDDGRGRSLRLVAQAAGAQAELPVQRGVKPMPVKAAEQSVVIFAERGDTCAQAWSQLVLGAANYGARQPARAAEAHARCLELLDGVDPAPMIAARAHLGIALHHALEHDPAAHRRHLEEGIDQLDAAGRLAFDYEWLWAASSLARSERRMEAALRLAGAAQNVGRRGNTLPPVATEVCDEAVAAATAEVGPQQARRLLDRGVEMSTEEAVADALALPGGRATPLSAREMEVARLTGRGMSNAEIADELFISRRTVESHQVHIREKLELASRYEVMAWAMAEESG